MPTENYKVVCPSCGEVETRPYNIKDGPQRIWISEIGYGDSLSKFQLEQGTYEPEAAGAVVEEDYCHTCLYWMNLYCHRDSHRSIRINGVHYWLYDPRSDGVGFQPFGGQEFVIRRKGFANRESVMMWYNAEIPDALREDLFDNAEFVK